MSETQVNKLQGWIPAIVVVCTCIIFIIRSDEKTEKLSIKLDNTNFYINLLADNLKEIKLDQKDMERENQQLKNDVLLLKSKFLIKQDK